MATDTTPSASASITSQEQQQQSGMAPMGMPPQDGPSPKAGDQPPVAPPGTYHPLAALPAGHPAPYQAAQQTYPGAAFPPQGFPPYVYPPPMYPPGAGPPFGQPYYAPYPPAGYPTQQPQQQQSRPQEKSADTQKNGAPRKSPSRRNKSPRKAMAPPKTSHDAAAERHHHDMNNAAELAASVKPMRTAFHFFVDDMQEKLLQEAEAEVKSSTNEVDLYLVNSNLNCRIMKEWEDAKQDVRDLYMEKEEADRKRFMADDEIASRHCATLTARARSPRLGPGGRRGQQRNYGDAADEEESSESGGSQAKGEEEEDKQRTESPTENGESPTKKSRTEEEAADE